MARRLPARGVQYVEVSDLAVRAAVYRMVKPGTALQFLMFPIIHVGTPVYFAAVRARLGACDFVLAEGVGGRTAAMLTRAYTVGGRLRQQGLVIQAEALDLRSLGPRVVRADLGAVAFEESWRAVPYLERVAMRIGVHLYAAYLRLHGTKELLARRLQTEDLPTPEEVMMAGAAPELDDALLGRRDAFLAEHLRRVHDEHAHVGQPMTVAVVYGAGHMRAASAYLSVRLGYHVASAEWLTVFEF